MCNIDILGRLCVTCAGSEEVIKKVQEVGDLLHAILKAVASIRYVPTNG